MESFFLFSSSVFSWVALPLFIFCARVLDVSMGTIRVIFISRGFKYYAPVIGFFEILVWLFAISQIMQNLNNLFLTVVYAAGFAAGTFAGIYLEEKLSLGTVIIRVITRKNSDEIISGLKAMHFKTTVIDAEGTNGQVKLIFTVTKRHSAGKVLEIIKTFNPKAFYSIEDVKTVSEHHIPSPRDFFSYLRFFPPSRKSK